MFLLINKPKGITSHDVIYRIRRIVSSKPPSSELRRVKVGHAGTLDPNATGLLIVGVGRESTKKLGDLTTNTHKTYIAEIVLGEERSTDDVEGKIVEKKQETNDKEDKQFSITNFQFSNRKPTKSQVIKTLKEFEGEQEQIPPQYSAIKIKGKKAYEIARKGDSLNLSPRKIIVYKSKLTRYKYPIIEVEFEVSSGTYIRSLTRDIGRTLGTYGYLGNLVRTKVGKHSLDMAVDLDKLTTDNWEQFAVEL